MFQYAPGATPLDPDEAEALIPSHITTQGSLNEWEQANILEARRWASDPKGLARADICSEPYLRELHRRMFDSTWRWAGTFRRTEKNLGVAPEQIGTRLRDLCLDVGAQIAYGTYPLAEIAARFHHRLVWIHPFPNGNGRHARQVVDLLLMKAGHPIFTWGEDPLLTAGSVRARYIDSLRQADHRNLGPLLQFLGIAPAGAGAPPPGAVTPGQ